MRTFRSLGRPTGSALVDGRLKPPDAFARITADTVNTGDDDGETYGNGVGVSMQDGRKVISHGGGIKGFASLLAYYPEADLTVAILANTEGFNTGALLRRIMDVMEPGASQSDEKKGK